MDIIDVAVPIIIHPIVGDFILVDPHAPGKFRDAEIHSTINHRDNDVVGPVCRVPRQRRLNLWNSPVDGLLRNCV
ncbi:hypothetical protein ES703_51494 [subsurface metagenome]